MYGVSVFVPGSTMIFGEHAVLRGAWGLRAALDKGLRVTVIPRGDKRVHLHSALGHHEGQLDNLGHHPRLAYALGVLREKTAELSHGVDVVISSDLGEMGWGSSAAVVAGVLTALTLAQNQPVDKRRLYAEGLGVIHSVTGGVGSGADLAASLHGGIVAVRRLPEEEIVPLPADVPITLVYSGYKTPTADVVRQVEAAAQREPEHYDALFKKMSALSDQAVAAVKKQDWAALGKLFQEYYLCQKELGVSDDTLDSLVRTLNADPGVMGAKIAGAGLGDCVVALGHASTHTHVQISAEGVREVPLQASDIVAHLTGFSKALAKEEAKSFAPVNIALVKYWGKRDTALNLPVTDSLSVTLPWGTHSRLSMSNTGCDVIVLNGEEQLSASSFYQRTAAALDLFRPRPDFFYRLETRNDLPTAAGLASSASGLAALTLALNDFWGWDLAPEELSIIARLLSGSACRSVFGSQGFVRWRKGVRPDGLDSHAELLPQRWPGLCLGVILLTSATKEISSREGMAQTQESLAYTGWPAQVDKNLTEVLQALEAPDFKSLGQAVEENALAMHATTVPPNMYFLPETWDALGHIQRLRQQGVAVYATLDAGPNVKVLFEENATTLAALKRIFGQAFIWAKVF